MIESLMLMALGFLVATLFALVAAQLVWRRAVKVTERRLQTTETAEEKAARSAELDALLVQQKRDLEPLQAEIERLRAQNRDLAGANNELARDNARLASEAAALGGKLNEINNLLETATAESAARGKGLVLVQRELASLEQAIAEEARRHEAARDHLHNLSASAARLGEEVQGTLALKSPEKTEPGQALEPYPDAERDADAQTLAEVKASLLKELEETEGAASARDETADAHLGDRTLAARIRALEAGVAS